MAAVPDKCVPWHSLRCPDEASCLAEASRVQVPLQRVLVVYDDMDLASGAVRLRAKGGHGGHNGMRSITQHFSGSKEFPRLRIGIWPAGIFQLCCCPFRMLCISGGTR